MKNLQRELLSVHDANKILSYTTDIALTPHLVQSINYKYDNTIAIGTGSSYTYPRAMYLYGRFDTPETPTQSFFPVEIWSDGTQSLMYDPSDAEHRTYGFYLIDDSNIPAYDVTKILDKLYLLDIYYIVVFEDGRTILVFDPNEPEHYGDGFYLLDQTYSERNVTRALDLARQNGVSIDPIEFIANYFYNLYSNYARRDTSSSGTRAPSEEKQIQIYPPIVYTTLSTLKRGNRSNYDWNFTMDSRISILAPIDYNTTRMTYLFKGIFTVKYSTNADMSNIQTKTIPSFNPATESNSTRYAYVMYNTVCIRDPELPMLPENIENIYSSFPSNTCSFVDIELNTDILNDLKEKYTTTFYPLAYNRNTNAGSDDLQILRREFSLGDNINYRTEYKTQQYSYLQFYNYATNSMINAANPFLFKTDISGLCGLNYKISNYTSNGDDQQVVGSYTICDQMPSTTMDVFLLKVTNNGMITNGFTSAQQTALSKVTHYNNSGSNSGWCVSSGISKSDMIHSEYTLSYITHNVIPCRTKVDCAWLVGEERLHAIPGFKLRMLPNDIQPTLPAFSMWHGRNKVDKADSITYFTYDFIYNSGTGRNLFGFIEAQQITVSRSDAHLALYVSYMGGTTGMGAYVSNQSVNTNNVGNHGTYFLVGANICVPFYTNSNDSGILEFKKGLVISPNMIYCKKVTVAGNYYYTNLV